MKAKEILINYLNLAPVVKCHIIDGTDKSTLVNLKIYADRRFRKLILQFIEDGTFVFEESEEYVICKSSTGIAIKFKDVFIDNMAVNCYLTKIKFPKQELEEFSKKPKVAQRTVKEHADYLFGAFIAEMGGEDWIAEKTWEAKAGGLIHNNNPSNVAYTRLRVMLKRNLNTFKNFNEPIKKNSNRRKGNA